MVQFVYGDLRHDIIPAGAGVGVYVVLPISWVPVPAGIRPQKEVRK